MKAEFSLNLRFVPGEDLHFEGSAELGAMLRFVQPLLLSLPSLPSLTPEPSLPLPVAPSKVGKIAVSHKKPPANKKKSCTFCGDRFEGTGKFCSASHAGKYARHIQREREVEKAAAKATSNGALPLPRAELPANLQ